MNYKVEVAVSFKKQAKRLSRKFPSIKNELLQLVNSLEIEPKQGKPLSYAVRSICLTNN